MKKLVLIDGNSLLNRAYYATPIFTTRSGMPTNAIFGFVKLLFKILDDLKPEYIIVAFDLKTPTFRHKMYGEYKATRKAMPDDLAAQVEPLKNLLEAMKIATCSVEGYEADDVIGTLSKKFDVHSYIYTGDRDSFQLVDENTDVYFTKRGVSDLLKLNKSNFKSETGIEPLQVIDLKALMGDKSDNIPGIPGVGEKTARDLLACYGTLDGVYENLDAFKGSIKEKLINNRELAYLSYKLATIDRSCPLKIELENCTAPGKYNSDVRKLFTDLEFNSFLGLDIFAHDVAANQEVRRYPEKVVCTAVDDFNKYFSGEKIFAVIVEENSAEIYAGDTQLTVRVSESLFTDDGISYENYVEMLRLIFSEENHRIITYDCKALMHTLKKHGVEFKCSFDDVALAKYLCDYNAAGLDLNGLCEYYLFDDGFRAFAVSELFKKYTEILGNDKMTGLYEDIEKPLLSILYDMENFGVTVSLDMLEELSKRYEALLSECRNKIYEACGCEFNINSPAKLGEVLFEKVGIKEVKKKKTGKYATNAEVLEKYKGEYPVIDEILKYRLYQKLYSTYLEGFKPLIDKNTHLVHTTFNQTITSTGRLSSTNPNLQNIPIRVDEGRELRKMFVPREGNVFVDADYSQIELRLLAHFSGCKELVKAYNEGADIHTATASQVFGVSPEEVTPAMRRDAKAVNFGIIYGISEFGLSHNLDIPLEKAKEYIAKYFETYSAVKDYMQSNVEFAKENGYVTTLTGRKRVIPEIKSANYNLRQFGERAAMNMPLQGSSADIIKIAMINVSNALKQSNLKTRLILQVHDELVLDAPEAEAEKAAEILKREMENAVQLKVPLTVDVHCGKNWYDAK